MVVNRGSGGCLYAHDVFPRIALGRRGSVVNLDTHADGHCLHNTELLLKLLDVLLAGIGDQLALFELFDFPFVIVVQFTHVIDQTLFRKRRFDL